MAELIILIAGFILLSGFWAMIDAAFLSISPAEIEVMIQRKYYGANVLKAIHRRTTRVIIVIVIVTNITNILGPILIGRKAEALFGSQVIGIITALLTLLTIIFSEVIPKSIGTTLAPRISRYAAPMLQVLMYILFPIVIVLEKIVKIFKKGRRKVGTEEQIRALANLGGGAGHIDADERELIHKAFALNDRKAKDIMTPAEKMQTLRKSTTIRRAAKMVFDFNFSRFPVLSDSGKRGVGYVLSKDILESLADGDDDLLVAHLIRPIETISADIRCDDLLHALRKSGSQIALVSDGTVVSGLVTLEDVLEELIGEIQDEND